MCGDYQIVIAWMDSQIAYGDIREVTAFILSPLSTAIDRDPQAHFCADEQQAFVHKVFFYNMRIAVNI